MTRDGHENKCRVTSDALNATETPAHLIRVPHWHVASRLQLDLPPQVRSRVRDGEPSIAKRNVAFPCDFALSLDLTSKCARLARSKEESSCRRRTGKLTQGVCKSAAHRISRLRPRANRTWKGTGKHGIRTHRQSDLTQ